MDLKVQNFWPHMEINYRYARCDLDYQGPQLKIDQEQPFNEVGLGDYKHFAREIRQESESTLVMGIQRRAQEGDRFVQEIGSRDTVSQIAKEQRSEIPELSVKLAPKSRPETEFFYQLTINWQREELQIEAVTKPPQITWYKHDGAIIGEKGSKLDLMG